MDVTDTEADVELLLDLSIETHCACMPEMDVAMLANAFQHPAKSCSRKCAIPTFRTNSTASTPLKIADVGPIAKPSVITTAAVKPGSRNNARAGHNGNCI